MDPLRGCIAKLELLVGRSVWGAVVGSKPHRQALQVKSQGLTTASIAAGMGRGASHAD